MEVSEGKWQCKLMQWLVLYCDSPWGNDPKGMSFHWQKRIVKPSTWIIMPCLYQFLRDCLPQFWPFPRLWAWQFILFKECSNGQKLCVPLLPRNWLPFKFVNMVQSQKCSPGDTTGIRALGVLGSEPVHSPPLDALHFTSASLIHSTVFPVDIIHWERPLWHCSHLAFYMPSKNPFVQSTEVTWQPVFCVVVTT